MKIDLYTNVALTFFFECNPFFCLTKIITRKKAAEINIKANPTILFTIIEPNRKRRKEIPSAQPAIIKNLPRIPMNSRGRCSPLNTMKV